MPLTLVYEDLWSIDLKLDETLSHALDANHCRAVEDQQEENFRIKLSSCVANAISGFLDLDLQLPSARQVKYATDIARELGIDVPAEALRYQGVCKDFIDRFVESFKAKRAGRSA